VKLKMNLVQGSGTRFIGPFQTSRVIDVETKVKLGKIGLFSRNLGHNLTHMNSDAPRQPTFRLVKSSLPKPPTWDGMVAKAGSVAERTAAKGRSAAGIQYEVRVGDNEHVRYAKTLGEAQKMADACSGYVHDHTEGMVVYESLGRKRRFGRDRAADVPASGEMDAGEEVSG